MKNIFITFLFFITMNAYADTIYKYEEVKLKEKIETTWEEEEKDKKLILTGTDEKSTVILECSEKYEIEKYDFKSKKSDLMYTFTLDKNILKATGKIKNTPMEKEIKISPPWIQQFGFGLKPFATSKEKSLKFSLLKPDDFTLQKMVATKQNKEKIIAFGNTYETIKIFVTLQGFKSMFWKARLWFDIKTGTLVKYMANEGPNTPTVTITLKSVEKKGTLDKIKSSLLNELQRKK